MSRKVSISILLLLFVMNSIGVHLLFLYQHQQARSEAANHTSLKPEVTLIIPISETVAGSITFRRVKKGEIDYRGNRYDIHTEKRSGENLVIKAHRDNKEDKALRTLAKHREQDGSSPVKSKSAPKIILYDLPPQSELLVTDSSTKEEHFVIPFTPLISPFFVVAVPPPEFS